MRRSSGVLTNSSTTAVVDHYGWGDEGVMVWDQGVGASQTGQAGRTPKRPLLDQ